MEVTTDTGIVLQGSSAERYIEERVLEQLRQTDDVSVPVSFATRQTHTPIGLGSGPTDAQLVNENLGWPAIANRATMDRIAGIDWFAAERVFDREKGAFGYEPLPEHPLNEILEQPNPLLSGSKLRMIVAGLVQQTGACYLQKLRDPLGVPRELWPIPSQFIEPVSADGMVIGAYRVTSADGQTWHLPAEDVVRIWRPDIKSIWAALGVLGPQAITYDALKFMGEHQRGHYKHDATPRTALKATPEASTPDQRQKRELLSAWRRQHNRRTGSEIGLPVLLPPGFDVYEFKADELDEGQALFEESWARQLMAAAGVPRFAVGIDTNTNRATGETTMWAWDQNSILPLTRLIAEDLTLQLARPDFFETLTVRFADFVAPDKEFNRSQEDQDLRTGARSINEVRASRDMQSVPWGDQPRGTLAETPYTGEAIDLTGGSDDGREDPNDLGPPRSAGRRMSRAEAAEHFEPQAVWERNLRVEKRFVGKFGAAQLRVWDAQRIEAQRRLAALADVDEEDVRAVLKGPAKRRRSALRRSPALASGFSRAIGPEELFSEGDWSDVYASETGAVRAGVVGVAATDVLAALAPETEFVLDGFIEQELRAQGAQHVTRVNATTRSRLAATLAEAATSGESISQIAARVDLVFQNRKRSRTVARTEVGAANQAGTLEGFRRSGVVAAKRWHTSLDGSVRDSHAIDGQTVQTSQRFRLGSGATASHPLDRSLPVGDLANCRCFMTPVLIDEPEGGSQ